MIIDTHLHESKYSPDSHLSLTEAIETAKSLGLDGICVTDHDNNYLKNDIGTSKKIDDILVIVGAEILTFEGDILVFGLDKVPKDMVHAEELLEIVKRNHGVAISAHPFRNNNRGLGEYIRNVKDNLHGIEAFNGSTLPHHNLYAYALATELGIPCLGAGDAHLYKQVGKYATYFNDSIRDEKDFIDAIKTKDFCPVIRKNEQFEKIDIYKTPF
ncbi:PHP-associated domain-containing protein [Clostridiisalibacter paucivorans]|uniref:PHP-associated domain-containing protein n=1 Tax=Clostridiisalibacter paucivorans TaxID=408753 RepID=UPI00047EBC68|nr:PHP domain-containing protein [Clostridiisalibacter paucivorans]